MPKTTEQYNEIRLEKKQLIMNVALELFAEHGFKSTSISQIAEAAGISKGLMYNYFCSKEDLLKAVIINLVDEICNMIDPNHDKIISEEEALQFFDKYFDMLQSRTNEFKLLLQICTQQEAYSFINKNMLLRRMVEYFGMFTVFFKKRNTKNPKMMMMNFNSIIRGFTTQYIFSPNLFTKKLLTEYKNYLKETFILNTR